MVAKENQDRFFVRHRWLVGTLGVIAAVVILASFRSHGDIVPIRVATVNRSSIRSVVSTNGKVEPLRSFEAHAPAGTTVKRLLVKEGEHVKSGQLLVQLDDAEARSQAARALAQVRGAQADIHAIQHGGSHEELMTLDTQLEKTRAARDAAQHNFEALQRLQTQGAASPGEVKDAQNQLSSIEADLNLLEQKQKERYSSPEVARVESQKTEAEAAYAAAEDVLRQLDIRAPFEGVVYSLPVHLGGYLNPGDMVLQEADLSKVLVRAFVDEPDVGRLDSGQPIEVSWDAMPGRIWRGTVSNIPATVKLHGTRNVGETTCVVNNDDFKLLPNVNVGVTIVTAEHPNVLTVPREAVRLDDSKMFVYQIVDSTLQRRDIQTAVSNLTRVEVTGGISENAIVAMTAVNAKPLRDGLPIKVVQ
jgi:HlyD family secretion protein